MNFFISLFIYSILYNIKDNINNKKYLKISSDKIHLFLKFLNIIDIDENFNKVNYFYLYKL